MNNQQVNNKVDVQEIRTRKMMDKLIPYLFKNKLIDTNWTNTSDNVDYQFTAKTQSQLLTYDVEVKELSYPIEFFKKLGYCGVKCEKKAFMEEYNQKSGNDKLIYLMVATNAIIVYNFKDIDMNKCPLYLWEQKKTQYDDNSKVIKIPSFKLPLNQAKIININKQQFYD